MNETLWKPSPIMTDQGAPWHHGQDVLFVGCITGMVAGPADMQGLGLQVLGPKGSLA